MAQCFKSSHIVTTSRLALHLMLSIIKPGMFNYLQSLILNPFCRCLAHIIDLATQAVISTCSKSKYYSGDPEDNAVPEDETGDRDEIGVIRAICVKVRLNLNFTLLHLCAEQAHSSSKCKQLFKTIQECLNICPWQLLLDMKVCWSSTYIMLTCA